jgi:hypothetical protein
MKSLMDIVLEEEMVLMYGRFLSGKWSEHENRKSENRKSTIC